MVDVWRPGGRSEERRPRHDRSRHRHHGHQDRPQEGVQPAAAAAEATDGANASVTAAGRRTAATISVSPVVMRRSKPQRRLRRKVRRFANQ